MRIKLQLSAITSPVSLLQMTQYANNVDDQDNVITETDLEISLSDRVQSSLYL